MTIERTSPLSVHFGPCLPHSDALQKAYSNQQQEHTQEELSRIMEAAANTIEFEIVKKICGKFVVKRAIRSRARSPRLRPVPFFES